MYALIWYNCLNLLKSVFKKRINIFITLTNLILTFYFACRMSYELMMYNGCARHCCVFAQVNVYSWTTKCFCDRNTSCLSPCLFSPKLSCGLRFLRSSTLPYQSLVCNPCTCQQSSHYPDITNTDSLMLSCLVNVYHSVGLTQCSVQLLINIYMFASSTSLVCGWVWQIPLLKIYCRVLK